MKSYLYFQSLVTCYRDPNAKIGRPKCYLIIYDGTTFRSKDALYVGITKIPRH